MIQEGISPLNLSYFGKKFRSRINHFNVLKTHQGAFFLSPIKLISGGNPPPDGYVYIVCNML
jgi:hypothetical protein